MGPLIKITTEPIQMVRFTQNARLVNSDSVDIERRKALARHMRSAAILRHRLLSLLKN